MSFYKKHPIGGMVLLLFILVLPVAGHADSEVELNGFQLWQFKSVVHDALGKPFKTIPRDSSTMEAHRIGPDAYMVFGYLKEWPKNISMIQVTGYIDNMLPFKGMVLGDDAQKIKRRLGPASSVKQVQQPKVQQWSYKETNYSVEVDETGKLYSIQINLNSYIMNEGGDNFDPWEDFKKAVLAKDTAGVLNSLRPDVEIYRKGKTLTIDKPMAEFTRKPASEFMSAFWGNKDSVLAALQQSEPEAESRLTTKIGMGMVFKFYKGTIIREIAFFPFNGKYRVYEIAFRGKCSSKPKTSMEC